MRISTTGRLNKHAGFTLIEIVLVVFLIGLMASLSLPLISGFEPDGLKTSARRLTGTVKYLYNEAALTGLEHRLIFNLQEGRYKAVRLEISGEIKDLQGIGATKKLSDDVRFSRIYQPQRGEQSSGEVTTALLPGGWLEETIIHLQDENNQQLTLRLVPMTGLTEIYQGERDFR